MILDLQKSFLGIFGHKNLIILLEDELQRFPYPDFVIDDQHTGHSPTSSE
jgi:hypothetical protein